MNSHGGQSPRCDAVKAALAAGGIAADVVDDVVVRMWNKFFGWACIATISSLTRSRAGTIEAKGDRSILRFQVIDECAKIVTAEGYPPPQDFVGLVRGLFSQLDSSSRVSMLVDMDEGRPTEGEQTIGDLVARAAQRGIAAPILTAALCNLQAYEINRVAKSG